jgi:phosphoacetylglucosamine mutase
VLTLNNAAVGDAVTNLLIVDLALRHFKWTLADLAKLYQDACARTSKIKVKSRQAVSTTPLEDKVLTPSSLQSSIDSAIL